MNIYAESGTKIRCNTLTAGYYYDRKHAEKYLTVGGAYTVDKTIVHDWHTEVYLKEFISESPFNSVFFEDINENDVNN